jgi:hypothetical protein
MNKGKILALSALFLGFANSAEINGDRVFQPKRNLQMDNYNGDSLLLVGDNSQILLGGGDAATIPHTHTITGLPVN